MIDKCVSSLAFDLMACDFLNFVILGELSEACRYLRKNVKAMRLSSQQKEIVQKLTKQLVLGDLL